MNYNIDHNILKDPIFKKLNGSARRTTWLVWSLVSHFTKNIGYVDLYVNQYAIDLGVHRKTVQASLNYLVDQGWIKIIGEWQREGNVPRRYVATKHSQARQKHSQTDTQAWSGGAIVNNSKRIINSDNDSFKKNQSQIGKKETLLDIVNKNRNTKQSWEK